VEFEKIIDSNDGIIVFLDVLATKSMWKEEDAIPFLTTLDTLFTKFDLLKEFATQLKNLPLLTYHIKDESFKYKSPPRIEIESSFFSDTIIVAIYGNLPLLDAFWIYLTGSFLVPLFREAFVNKIFLRGTISIGKFHRLKTKDRVLLIGPAVNEAAETYENTDWIGISAAPSATLTLEQNQSFEEFKKSEIRVSIGDNHFDLRELMSPIISSFRNYHIPRKGYIEKGGWALAWPCFYNSLDSDSSQERIIQILKDNLSASLFHKRHIDSDVFIKFRNTLDFFNSFSKDSIDLSNVLSIGTFFRNEFNKEKNEKGLNSNTTI
jgi:hypothetical protein